MGGEENERGKSKKLSTEEIELKDYRPKSDRVTMNPKEIIKKPVNISNLHANSATVRDAVRDENESRLSPRAHVILFQEGPSVPVSHTKRYFNSYIFLEGSPHMIDGCLNKVIR